MNTKVIVNSTAVKYTLIFLTAVTVVFFAFSAEAAIRKGANTTVSAETLTCMQTAVDTRETALMTAFDSFNADVKSALTDRKAALNAAWAMSEGTARSAAIKEAWSDWKAAKKTAHSELKKDKTAAWTTFKTTAHTTCKETLPKQEILEKETSGTISL
jgi:hypothetical protein